MSENTPHASKPPDQRQPTGITGLDDILGGGLSRNCFYLLQGNPGSGKTTLALQFLREGLRRGESVLSVTLSETRPELLKVATSHGWSLEGIPMLELSAIEALLWPEAQTTVFHPSEVELNEVTGLLLEEMRRIKPARAVFDSLSEFRLKAETALRYRWQLLVSQAAEVSDIERFGCLSDTQGGEQISDAVLSWLTNDGATAAVLENVVTRTRGLLFPPFTELWP
jgi:KaiC/GvpD/RAD55 family RecA-like ATPase